MKLRADRRVTGCAGSKKEQRVLVTNGVGVVGLGKEFAGVGELRLELMADLVTHGVGFRTNARADGCDQVLWIAAVLQAQGADTALNNTGESATPSSVKCSD